MPGFASMSIDAVVYPFPADVSSTAVITPSKSPSSVTVMLQVAPSPSPPMGTYNRCLFYVFCTTIMIRTFFSC
ncbi:MAG: hypothetical protein CM15mV13_3250 [uncultured marine virus]|nr:MAG: hypothetical protein CM15mV13_3250 [uncultured marine virus]